MTIRPFDPDTDYPACVALWNANFPDFTESAEEFRYHDGYREADKPFARFVAEANGVALGYAQFDQGVSDYHPEKFNIDTVVAPEAQGAGVGRALYEHLLAELAAHNPLAVKVWTMETLERSVRFLADRGFAEQMRVAESWLEVGGFDPAPFGDAEARVLSQGIRLTSFAELEATDPDARAKFYDLTQEASADVPRTEAYVPVPYDVWVKRFESPNYRAESQFIAVDGDRYVGLSALWGRQTDDHLQTGFTGVRRSHRRRGIALALKLRALDYARRTGAPIIRTDNAEQNEGMLSINRALGFVRQPAWIGYEKTLRG